MSKLKQLLFIDKAELLWDIIKFNGGIKNAMWTLFRTDDLKIGKLVGVDKFGNRYYENNRYFYSKNRWVIYNDAVNLDYDASMVPAEWYGWLHYKTDYIPTADPTRPKYFWMQDGNENMTGTPQQYVPYSTTRPKIQAWQPPKKK